MKEKISLRLYQYNGKPIQAKRETPFEIRLQARLLLDAICFSYNRTKLEEEINHCLKGKDEKSFLRLSETYRQYLL